MDGCVDFTPEAVKEYLDTAIRRWRDKKNIAKTHDGWNMAVHYIDAFQSVRASLFGETLPE